VGTSTPKGVEITADLQLSDSLRLTSNYTYNDTERPNGLQRRRRPEDLMNIGLAYTALGDRLNINGFYRISRDATDEIFGSPVDLDDFEVLDISASYRFTDNFSIYARLENALDEDYEEITGFYSPDRAAYLGFKLNFSAN
jgi:vitamin B12 transporter